LFSGTVAYMLRETIEVPTEDGTAQAYVSRPDDNNHPGVLFYMDGIGVRPQLYDMADRIAGWGYVVMVPNLFYRDGTIADLQPTEDLSIPGNREQFFAGVMPRIRAFVPERAAADAHAYVDRLLGLPGVADTAIGCTGYCMGGALSLRTAGLRPDQVAAAGSFHGGNLVTESGDSPHLVATQARAQFYLGHADNDQSMPADKITVLEQTFDSAGLRYTSEIYADAQHGYTMADTSSYQEVGAERHFEALRALLAHSLAG
jgi:carboxymethylenebutenolidase